MADKVNIEDVFREKLEGFEPEVDPSVWNAVSSQIQTPIAPNGSFSIVKAGIISVVAAAVVGAVFWVSMSSEEQIVRTKPGNKSKEPVEQKSKGLNTGDEFDYQQESQVPSEQTTNNSTTINKTERIQDQTRPLSEEPKLNALKEDYTLKTHAVTTTKDEPLNVEAIPATSNASTSIDNTEVVDKKEDIPTHSFTLPNIFTPNGDGSNDVFTISADGLTDFQLVILNTKNQVVFTSSDPEAEWTGLLLNGDPAPEGNYLYYFTARTKSGEAVSRSSALKLVR
ncbi:MAG: gliding motility-associated C-terminal domain-containing protein [Cryomorphaceae bacterium]|nr:gliding motility-associated C-terminal domain-containing protein [Cryomorphaceae bacterium]